MPRSVSEEVKIMNAFRALPEAKRDVVLNLVIAEFRSKGKAKTPKIALPVSRGRASAAARPIVSETAGTQGSLTSLGSITLPGDQVRQ